MSEGVDRFVLDWANDKGQTALHLAAKEGHVEIAKVSSIRCL